MICPDELTLAMFADGELSAGEMSAIQGHTALCSRCRVLVSALDVERQVLSRALLEVAPVEAASPARESAAERRVPVSGGLAVAATVALVVGLLQLLDVLAAVAALPPPFEWLSPFHFSGQMNLLATAATYGVLEGGTMLTWVETATSQFVMTVLLLLILPTLARAVRRSLSTGLMVVAALAAVSPAEALQVRRSQQDVIVAVGETVDDTLVAFGDTITVDGTVTGDLIVAARRVRVRGTINGNLVSFAQEVEVEGEIGGAIFGFAQTVRATGSVGGSLYAFAQGVNLAPDSRIDGNATTFAGTTAVEGVVRRDVTAFAQRVDVAGTVERNVTARAERVTLSAPARIGGNLTAQVSRADNVQVLPGATVGGRTDVQVAGREAARSRYLAGSFYLRQVLRLTAAFLTGWLLFWLAPRSADVRLETPTAVLKALGVGFLCLVAMPAAALVAAITLVGVPVAVAALGVWVAGLYLSKILVAAFLGRRLLGADADRGLALPLAAGLLLVIVAVNLPYVGSLINLALTLIGLGLLFAALMTWYRSNAVTMAQ